MMCELWEMKALLFLLLFHSPDTVHPDYRKIYGAALDADVRTSLRLLPADTGGLVVPDAVFVRDFGERFGSSEDRSVDGLLSVYKQYWRKSLLDTAVNYDSMLIRQLRYFLGGDSID